MEETEVKPKQRSKIRFFLRIILLWILMALFIKVGFIYGWDKKVMAAGVIVFGFISQAFAGLLAVIAMVPILGPILVRVLSWPVFLTINGLAYLVTFFAIKAGMVKDAVNSKVLVTMFLIGTLLGFILGKIF